MKKLLVTATLIIIVALSGAPAHALGTAAGTNLSAQCSFNVYNATATTVTSSASNSVLAIYGFDTAAYTEQAAKSAAAGATATYDFTLRSRANAADNLFVDIGPQTFSGTTGPTNEWAVAAERVGGPFLSFTTSGKATAAQAGDSAQISAVASDTLFTLRLHNHTSPSAANAAFSSYTVAFRTTNFPGAAYTGFNGTTYAGPTTWARQLDGGYVITTVNGITLTAAKNITVAAPAAYVTAGGGANDVVPGSVVNYSIQFSNTGAVAATTVIILDDFPTDVTFQPGSIKSCFTGAACVLAADPDTNDADPDCYYIPGATPQIRCDIASLAPGGAGKLAYAAVIN